MLVWIGRIVLSIAIFGLFAISSVHAQNTGNQGGGFRALSGAEAAFFALPDDMDLVSSTRLGRYGLTYERYQQAFGSAKVLGGQLTLYRDDAGAVTTVIGAHYPNIAPTNSVRLTPAAAHGIVDRDVGPEGRRITDLMIDPRSGRYFFQVETRRPDSRWILWIGAQGGQVINKFNALAHQSAPSCATAADVPCGYGVEHDIGFVPEDVKDLDGLISFDGSEYSMWVDWGGKRQGTYDQGSVTTPIFQIYPAVDSDNLWTSLGDVSPAQQALVDTHYYGNLADDYLWGTHGFRWWEWARDDPYAQYDFMAIAAHYFSNYNNASWNGDFVVLGDGDQVTFRELTSLDVIVHELIHGVTDFTSDLIYQNESGALNEAFSDIMAASAEFYADDPNGDGETSDSLETPGLEPDWLVGEDIYIPEFGTAAPGFRNMADPEEDGDPDHYSERYTGTNDNGGVHTNSGIPNHAYYLLVNGGLNASCASPGDHNSLHCTGFEVPVTGIDLADAEAIFFLAFTALDSNATMCDARAATEAVAEGVGIQQLNSTLEAWEAVGLDQACGLPPNSPPDPATIADQFNQDGDTVSVDASTTDVDDATLTYVAAGLPEGLNIGLDDGQITGTIDSNASQGGPSENGVYTVVVTAYDDTTHTDYPSFTWTVTNGGVGNTAPTNRPTSVSATDLGGGFARITWSDSNPDENGFEIERQKMTGNGSWKSSTILGPIAAMSHDDDSGKGTFHYRVRAFNNNGPGPWSSGWNQVVVTTGTDGGTGDSGTINCKKKQNRDLDECKNL